MARLRHEDEVEDGLEGRTGLFRNIRIAREERLKFGLLGAMFFIIGFIYSFMRILKDMFVLKRQSPSCFNFIKIFYILPISFAIIIIINYLLQKRSISKIFNICLFIFFSAFLFFGTFIIFEDQVMFDNEMLLAKYEDSNTFLKDFIYTIAEPIATLIYITAELWGSIILSYMFLSYLNESCPERQHGRFIPPLFILTNISLLASALVTTGMMKAKENMSDGALKIFMGCFFLLEAALTAIIIFLKYFLETRVMTTPIFIPKERKEKKPKPKVSFIESLKIMCKSKFLLAMCGIVFFYNALYNLIDTVYKFGITAGAAANEMDKSDYSAKFNNIEQYITSLTVIFLNLTSFSHLTDTRGWTFVAMITPFVAGCAIIGVFGLGSYNSALEEESFGFVNKLVKGTPKYGLENYTGMFIMSSMKIFKYTASDVTKERISMKIENRYRPKFKSIYDGFCNKLGKSGGSIYGIIIGAMFSSIDPRGASPLTGIISALFVFLWVWGIFYLGANYNEAVKKNTNINIDIVGDLEDENVELVDSKTEKPMENNTNQEEIQKTSE